jgi:putative flippase GtrA
MVVREDLRPFLRFLAVGGGCYLLGLLLLFLLVEVARLHYLMAMALAFLGVCLVGHAGNRWHTFRSDAPYAPELARFAVALTAQMLAALAGMWLLVDALGVHYILANVLVTVPLTLASFLVNRSKVFRHA